MVFLLVLNIYGVPTTSLVKTSKVLPCLSNGHNLSPNISDRFHLRLAESIVTFAVSVIKIVQTHNSAVLDGLLLIFLEIIVKTKDKSIFNHNSKF